MNASVEQLLLFRSALHCNTLRSGIEVPACQLVAFMLQNAVGPSQTPPVSSPIPVTALSLQHTVLHKSSIEIRT